ncbi:ABC transporter substrate-binding protein [uncultured Pelagimonas sp.]|uniref:ABC transporter substrate-binding protein n=1 Tax=uncultured Pelagimonas sp. TaxID=1618102 RepID=UPI002625F3B3|nr:ABC transporter substrate-binding protein [uncultured Pelagimonas sp.]
MNKFLTAACAAFISVASQASALDVVIHYIHQEVEQLPTLSNLDPIPDDLGAQGAQLALEDNTTTGRFLGQNYSLDITIVPVGGDFNQAVSEALTKTDLIVLDAPADHIIGAADLEKSSAALLFNVSAPDIALRSEDCRANLLHTLPSRPMQTDALMQFFVKRRWSDIALIEGTQPEDQAYAAAVLASARKFGMSIDARKTWAFDADMRRNAAQEVPLFTQDLGDYDVLVVADEANDFARYIPFNTWHPRPVAGADGLTAKAWDRVVEQWGAAQLQSRFEEQSGRAMLPRDYAAWAAVRSIGEAVTRTQAGDAQSLRDFLLSDQFELAGFKGRPLTYRSWNGQLRQPITLAHRGALVASAPLEGFLHQRSELDTLGLDKPESACSQFD